MPPPTVEELATLAANAISRAEVIEMVPEVVEFVIAALMVMSAAAPFEVIVRVLEFVPVQVNGVAKLITPVPPLPLVELIFTLLVVKLPKSPVAGLTVPTLMFDVAAVNE